MLKISSHPFCDSKMGFEEQTKHQLMPAGLFGEEFDRRAIKAKSLLNAEFMQRPMNSNVAIVWYHKGIGSHAGFSIDDKPYGFACFSHTREPKSLQKFLEKRVKVVKIGRCSATTVQYLKISPLQKRKIEQILDRKNFPCITCMHGVSRILAKATNIRIPFLVNQLPDTSLIYLKKLQENGEKALLKQKTFGLEKAILNNKNICDMGNRAAAACLAAGAALYYGNYFNLSTSSASFLFAATALGVLATIHLSMRTFNPTNKGNP